MDRALLLSLCVLVGGCPGPGVDDDDTSEEPEPRFGDAFIGGDRPTMVHVPADYDGVTPAPLVILLHGRGANPDLVDFLVGWRDRVDEDGVFLLVPESTTDAGGSPAWNWPLDPGEADDVAYITGLIDGMEAQWAIDPDRIHIAGQSNGGFMSYRMACALGDRLAAIMPFAALSPVDDEADCAPSGPVSVLHVHGTEDGSVPYAPTDGRLTVPALAAAWAERSGCTGEPEEATRRDITDTVDGDETRVDRWSEGCAGTHRIALWTMEGGGHNARFNDGGSAATLGWLLERRRGQ